MKKLLVFVSILTLMSCDKVIERIEIDRPNISVQNLYIAPGLDCPAGGFSVNILDNSDVLSSFIVCHGEKGDVGDTGPQGETGATGPQGIQGETGEIGPIGPQGVQGIAGTTGPQGPIGPQGPEGPQGVKGDTGAQGEAGSVGAQGPQGEPGIQGMPGTGGITAVQLCASDDANYKEYGFVVNNQIYAVYYGKVNNVLSAFLARLSAGNYVTTNDGTPCAFTISYPNGIPTIDGNPVGSTGSTGILVYTNTIDRQNGQNNNALVEVEFENQGSTSLTKFKVTIGGLASSQVRSGSSLTGPYGNVESYTNNSVTFLVTTSGGVSPGAKVKVKILLDKLTGSQDLVFSTQVL